MIAALLDEADRIVDQARTPLDLPKRHQALNKRDIERRGEKLVAGIVELTQTRPDRFDAFGGMAAPDRQFAFDAAADRKIGAHGARFGMGDEAVDVLFRGIEVSVPEIDRDRPDQRNAERDRMVHLRGLNDRLPGQLQRIRGAALQPELARERDAGPVAVIETIDGADSLRARPMPGGLQHRQRVAMLAGKMQGDTEERMGESEGEGGGPAECPGDRKALLRIAERGVELS